MGAEDRAIFRKATSNCEIQKKILDEKILDIQKKIETELDRIKRYSERIYCTKEEMKDKLEDTVFNLKQSLAHQDTFD